MALQVKVIQKEDITVFEIDTNTFLSTLDPKNVMDFFFSYDTIGKYGQEKFFTSAILYKV